MYPWKFPVKLVAANNWLRRTVQVAPDASVPSDDNPTPGLTVELVVKENGVPAPPVLVVGKKSTLIVPAVGIAEPPLEANGSAVVFATARPVSNGANAIAYGINNVVLTGRTFATVTGPTSVSVKHG